MVLDKPSSSIERRTANEIYAGRANRVVAKRHLGRSEFHDGETIAMAVASREYNAVKENLIGEQCARLKGGPCRTFSSDQRVKVDRTGLYTYPGIVLLCGPGEYDPADRDSLTNPTATLEVHSPATESFVPRAKFRHYRQIPALREYVLVSQEVPTIERYVRQPNGNWLLTTFADPGGDFVLACAQPLISLAECTGGVEPPPPPAP